MKYFILCILAFSQFSCGQTALSPENKIEEKQQTKTSSIDLIPVSPDFKADFSFETNADGEVVQSK